MTAAGDFASQPVIQAAGKPYQLFVRNAVAPLTTLNLSLRGLPTPGEPQYLDRRALLLVAGVLALLLSFLLGLYLRRGDLAFLFGLPDAPPAAPHAPTARVEARRVLLHKHLALDRARAVGKLDEADYRWQRDALRAQLRALLAADSSAAPARPGVSVHHAEDEMAAAGGVLADRAATPAHNQRRRASPLASGRGRDRQPAGDGVPAAAPAADAATPITPLPGGEGREGSTYE
jgi:hypothetical protein